MLRAVLFADPLIVLATVVFGTASLIASLFDRTGCTQHRIARLWARALLKAGGLKVELEGIEKLDPAGSYVLVSNHLSLMDTPLVIAHIPLQFRFFAKKGLFRIPFIGTHLRRAGHLPVVRGNARAGLKLMSEAARIMQERKISVLVFPEGGRAPGPMRAFKEGAAYVAIKAGVPAVPIGISGTRESLAMGSALVRPAHVRLRVGEPIPTAGMKIQDHGALTEQLQEKVRELTGGAAQVQCR